MRNKKFFLLIICSLFFFSCKSEKTKDETAYNEEPIIKTHYNIKIVSDLSNRLDAELYPRQLTDQEVINEVLMMFPSLTSNYNRLTHQKDKISYGLLNPMEVKLADYNDALTIDLGRFGINQKERIEFLKNRNENTIESSTKNFKLAVHDIYQKAIERETFYTARTWSYFKQVVDENYFALTNPLNSTKAQDVPRNVIILLTDGFMEEAARNSSKSCPEKVCDLLDSQRIEEFRQYYNSLEEKIPLQEAFAQSGYEIKPVDNPNLKDVEVLMLEINGRSKSKTGGVTKTPTDFEILKLFWQDFLKNEGVKKISIQQAQPSTDNIHQIVNAFLEE